MVSEDEKCKVHVGETEYTTAVVICGMCVLVGHNYVFTTERDNYSHSSQFCFMTSPKVTTLSPVLILSETVDNEAITTY